MFMVIILVENLILWFAKKYCLLRLNHDLPVFKVCIAKIQEKFLLSSHPGEPEQGIDRRTEVFERIILRTEKLGNPRLIP